MSTSTADRRPLVHLSVGDGHPGGEADGDDYNGGGGAKCLGMGVVGVGVTILVILALAGGVVAWIVLSHHDGGTTTLAPPTSPAITTTSRPLTGGPHCLHNDGDDCIQCQDGYMLHEDASGTNPKRCFYKCHTDLAFDVVEAGKKGLTVDDTTLHWCADNMPAHFPNTDAPVSGLRLFKAWQGNWNEAWLDRRDRWRDIARYLKHTGAKVLVGTQVTCNPEDDNRDWEDVKEMMQMFGPEHIMGLAVGNELELLWQKEDVQPVWVECMTMIWEDQYFLRVFHDRVRDMDSLGSEYASIPVTSVFGGAIFAGWPFAEVPVNPTPNPDGTRPLTAKIVSFCNNVTIDFGHRWVWTLNVYPYFDQGAYFDEDGTCHGEITRATCFVPPDGNPDSCEFTRLVKLMRERMHVENFNAAGAENGTLWIGETGWSFPKADTLSTMMQWCDEFSSEEVFQRYYKAFLEWDMQMTGTPYWGGHFQGPDYVFWFTMRDSSNFAMQEHFGLMGNGDPTQWCSNVTCKLQDHGFFDTTTTTPYTGPSTTTTISTASAATTTAGTTTAGTTSGGTTSAGTTSAGTTSAGTTSAGTSSAATSSTTSARTASTTTSSGAATSTGATSTTAPGGQMVV